MSDRYVCPDCGWDSGPLVPGMKERISHSCRAKAERIYLAVSDERIAQSNPDGGLALDYLSYSRLDTYNSCGLKYKLRYIDRVEERPQGALIAGSAIHETIAWAEQEEVWRTKQPPEAYLHERFSQLLDAGITEAGGEDAVRWGGRRSKHFPKGETRDWWLLIGPQMLDRYLALRMADDALGWQTYPGGIEMQMLVPLPDGTMLKAYLDALMMVTEDGERVLRDYKSGAVGRANPMQMATYVWLCQQALGVTPLAQFVYLRTAKLESRIKTVDVDALVPLVPQLYQDLLASLKTGFFPLRPSSFCTACGVKNACPYGQTLED